MQHPSLLLLLPSCRSHPKRRRDQGGRWCKSLQRPTLTGLPALVAWGGGEGAIHVAMVTSYVTRVFLTALANYSHWEIETPHTQTSYTFRRTHSTFHDDLRRGPTVFALRMPNQSSGAGVEVGAPPPSSLELSLTSRSTGHICLWNKYSTYRHD